MSSSRALIIQLDPNDHLLDTIITSMNIIKITLSAVKV